MSEVLDPEKLFVTDPNIPEFGVDGIGQQGKPDDEVEDESATEEEDSEKASEDEVTEDESEEVDEDETGDSEEDDTKADDGEDADEGDVFEIDGKEYTPESLSAKIVELERGSLRQSDYTKKTQELADTRKGIESNVAFVNAVKDADLMDSIVEALETSGVANAKEMVQAVINGDAGEHPDSIELAGMKDHLAQLDDEKEAEAKLDEEVQSLADRKEIDISEANKVRRFAEERYNETGTVLNMDDAYDLFLVRNGKLKVKRKQPTVPNTPRAKKGVKPKGESGKFEKMSAEHLFID